MQPVTNETIGYLELSRAQFYRLPAEIQELIKLYGIEHPQGFGKPSIIEMRVYRMQEIMRKIEAIGGI